GMEDGSDPTILLAVDLERSKDGTILDIDGIREFVQLFHDALGRYPVLYGGWTLRDTPEIVMGDELLGKCPTLVSALLLGAEGTAGKDLADLYALAVCRRTSRLWCATHQSAARR